MVSQKMVGLVCLRRRERINRSIICWNLFTLYSWTTFSTLEHFFSLLNFLSLRNYQRLVSSRVQDTEHWPHFENVLWMNVKYKWINTKKECLKASFSNVINFVISILSLFGYYNGIKWIGLMGFDTKNIWRKKTWSRREENKTI